MSRKVTSLTNLKYFYTSINFKFWYLFSLLSWIWFILNVIEITDVQFLPISGLMGSNMKERLDKKTCGWWDGPCLFEVLDKIEVPLGDPKGPVRSMICTSYCTFLPFFFSFFFFCLLTICLFSSHSFNITFIIY